MSDPQNTPWYPPGEGWIEWHGGDNPAPGCAVQWVARCERAEKRAFASDNHKSDADFLNWGHHADYSHDIVAYRVVTPAPSTVDRALFDEMVEALAPFAEVNITRATDWAEQNEPWPDDRRLFGFDGFWMTVGMVRKARAVLAKAREAGK